MHFSVPCKDASPTPVLQVQPPHTQLGSIMIFIILPHIRVMTQDPMSKNIELITVLPRDGLVSTVIRFAEGSLTDLINNPAALNNRCISSCIRMTNAQPHLLQH